MSASRRAWSAGMPPRTFFAISISVELDLVVQIPLGGLPLKKRLPPTRDRLERFHQLVPNTHSTADTYRRQLSVSVPSAVRPSSVSR